MGLVMWAIIGCGLLSLVYGALTVRAVMASDAGNRRVLAIEVRARTLLDRRRDRAHPLVARRQGQQRARSGRAIDDCGGGAHKRH